MTGRQERLVYTPCHQLVKQRKKFINPGWYEGTKLELRYIPNKLPLVVIKESRGSGPSSTFSS